MEVRAYVCTLMRACVDNLMNIHLFVFNRLIQAILLYKA